MKPKWKPKDGECYWGLTVYGSWLPTIHEDIWTNSKFGKKLYNYGCIFKTKREAQARYKEIVKFLKTGEILVKY